MVTIIIVSLKNFVSLYIILHFTASVKYVCTTADIWTSRSKKTYLGLTVHWIEEISLTRKSACLALVRIVGSTSYSVLAQHLDAVNIQFGIKNKITLTVTDSGSNFLKAFNIFGDSQCLLDKEEEIIATVLAEYDENEERDESEIVDTSEILCDFDPFDFGLIQLPPHRKCACHLLSRVATFDIKKVTNTRNFGKLYRY